jgi:molecular chaperone GrpE
MTTQDPHNTDPKTLEDTLEAIIEEATVDETPVWGWASETSPDDEIARLRESLARSQADYQNLLMRNDRDKIEMVSFLSGKILMPLLTQVDNLERAVALKAWVEWDSFVDGVRSMLASMEKYLESQWVTPFISLGVEVDPARHDVMTQGPGPEGQIVTEFERGYMLRDRVLRHAKVVVGSGE